MIRVMVVDDQAIVRQGVVALLAQVEDLQVVAEADRGEVFLEQINRNPDLADIVLMDVRMPGMDGIRAVLRLRAMQINIPVILLTTFDEPLLLAHGIAMGAQACLLKDEPLAVLVQAIRDVCEGNRVALPRSMARWRGELFTPRELDIVRQLCFGKANKEIAEALNLSAGTVRNYISLIFEKLDVSDRSQALIKLKDAGFG